MSKKGSRAGAIYVMVLGLVLALCGALFTWAMWRSYQRANEMHGWEQVEAVVLLSEVQEKQLSAAVIAEYRLGVLYGYQVDGKAYESERFSLRGARWKKKRDEVEELVNQYPEGDIVTCYVKPGDPGMAVLKPDTKAVGYSIWFPGLFVLGGLGIVLGAIRSLLPGEDAGAEKQGGDPQPETGH